MSNNKLLVLAVILLAAVNEVAWSHQDRILTLSEDGMINGLPDMYQPAMLKVGYVETNGTNKIESITLSIGDKQNDFPACLLDQIGAQSNDDILITASWYHERGGLPEYVGFTFYEPRADAEEKARSGHSLLFNLNTAGLIWAHHLKEGRRGSRRAPFDINAICSQREIDGITDERYMEYID
jgi:hypothetical protein